MRILAQVIGWIWLAWIAYVILGTLVISLIAIPGISSDGGVGPKLFVEELINLFLAIPGVLLVVWGRRRKKGQAEL